MARPCSACRHPSAAAIAAGLADGRSAARLAAEFGLSDDAILRHKAHLTRLTAPSSDPSLPADPLDELVTALRGRALAGDAASAREYRLALAAQTAARQATAPPVVLTATREWIALRGAILTALEPYPEARRAIAEAIA